MRALFVLLAVGGAAVMGVLIYTDASSTPNGAQAVGVAFLICGIGIVGALISGRGPR